MTIERHDQELSLDQLGAIAGASELALSLDLSMLKATSEGHGG